MAAKRVGERERRGGAGRPAAPARRAAAPRRAPRAEAPAEPAVPKAPPRPVAQVIADVGALARDVARGLGLEIDRVEFREAGRRALVQVFIDREGGVTLDDCTDVSRELSAVLDVHDVVPRAYVLEVSSPGLDRPLRGEEDFRRFAGRPAILTLRRAIGGGSRIEGVLRGVEDGEVLIERGRELLRVPLDVVAKARLDVDEQAVHEQRRAQARDPERAAGRTGHTGRPAGRPHDEGRAR